MRQRRSWGGHQYVPIHAEGELREQGEGHRDQATSYTEAPEQSHVETAGQDTAVTPGNTTALKPWDTGAKGQEEMCS